MSKNPFIHSFDFDNLLQASAYDDGEETESERHHGAWSRTLFSSNKQHDGNYIWLDPIIDRKVQFFICIQRK